MPLSDADIGRRVVVRRRLGGTGAGAACTDVLGELVSLDGDQLVVRRRDATLVSIGLGDVTAAKPIPPAPRRRPSDRELEAIAALGWRGLEQTRLGGWLLRAGNGFTGRANSMLPLDQPDRPLADALAFVTDWYAERGLPPLAQVPLPLAADLDDTLAGLGWRAYNASRFLVGGITDVLDTCRPRPDLPPVVHEPAPGAEWLAGYHYRGKALPAGAVDVLTGAADPTFAAVTGPDGLLGVARGVVEQGWLGVTAVTVPEGARRRGVARHLMRGLATWGGDRGARHVYLQVAEENTAALALYDGLGFRTHHRYHYRTSAP